MDITIDVDDYKLNIRSGGVIIHNNKVLLHKNINSDHYALIGGRVEIGEDSESTVKREILEEIGKIVKIKEYMATIENFFKMKGYKYHEIFFVYRVEFEKEEDKLIIDTLKNIEGKDHLQYEWIDVNEIDKCPIKPEIVKEILKAKVFPIHKINKEFKY